MTLENKVISLIERYGWYIFPLVAILIYAPTIGAGFVHDFTGWYERYETYSWSGFAHCWGYHRTQHLFHLVHFTIYKLFDTNPIAWHVIYSGSFGLTAYGLYLVSRLALGHIGLPHKYVPLMSAILFLVQPYAASPVIWKVCLHYIMMTGLFLWVVHFFIKWLVVPKSKYLWSISTCYFLGLYIHEIALVFPLLLILYSVVLISRNINQLKALYMKAILPMLVFVPIYFMISPCILLDEVADHMVTQLTFHPTNQMGSIWLYIYKYLIYSRFWSFSSKMQWDASWHDATYVWPSTIGMIIVLLILWKYRNRMSNAWSLVALSMISAAILILPSSSFDVMWLLYGSNDRFGLVASVPIYFALTLTMASIKPVRIGYFIYAMYFILSCIMLGRMLYFWHENGTVTRSLIEDYRWYDSPRVYALAGPDNFQGTFMFQAFDETELADHLMLTPRGKPQGEVIDVLQYNMTGRHDDVRVQVHSPDSLSVFFNQWGNWFWRYGVGAQSYQTEDYRVHVGEAWYHMKLLRPHPETVFIYPDKMKWSEVEGFGHWSTE